MSARSSGFSAPTCESACKNDPPLAVDKDLDAFEFTDSPVNEMQVKRLFEGSFLADHTNIGFNTLDQAGLLQAVHTGKREPHRDPGFWAGRADG